MRVKFDNKKSSVCIRQVIKNKIERAHRVVRYEQPENTSASGHKWINLMKPWQSTRSCFFLNDYPEEKHGRIFFLFLASSS